MAKKDKNILEQSADFIGGVGSSIVDGVSDTVGSITGDLKKGDVASATGKTADTAASIVVPYYSAGKDLANGDYIGAGIGATLDTLGLAGSIFTAGGSYAGTTGIKALLKGGTKAVTKEATEQVAKSAAKETTEQVVKSTVRETTEQVAKSAAKETTEQAVESTTKKASQKVLENGRKAVGDMMALGGSDDDLAKEATEATISSGVDVANQGEDMSIYSKMFKAGVNAVTKGAGEATENAAKNAAKEAAETAAKKGVKDYAKDVGGYALKHKGATAAAGVGAYYTAKNGGDIGAAASEATKDLGSAVVNTTTEAGVGAIGGTFAAAVGGASILAGKVSEGLSDMLEKNGMTGVGQVLDRAGDRLRGVGESIQKNGVTKADYSASTPDEDSSTSTSEVAESTASESSASSTSQTSTSYDVSDEAALRDAQESEKIKQQYEANQAQAKTQEKSTDNDYSVG